MFMNATRPQLVLGQQQQASDNVEWPHPPTDVFAFESSSQMTREQQRQQQQQNHLSQQQQTHQQSLSQDQAQLQFAQQLLCCTNAHTNNDIKAWLFHDDCSFNPNAAAAMNDRWFATPQLGDDEYMHDFYNANASDFSGMSLSPTSTYVSVPGRDLSHQQQQQQQQTQQDATTTTAFHWPDLATANPAMYGPPLNNCWESGPFGPFDPSNTNATHDGLPTAWLEHMDPSMPVLGECPPGALSTSLGSATTTMSGNSVVALSPPGSSASAYNGGGGSFSSSGASDAMASMSLEGMQHVANCGASPPQYNTQHHLPGAAYGVSPKLLRINPSPAPPLGSDDEQKHQPQQQFHHHHALPQRHSNTQPAAAAAASTKSSSTIMRRTTRKELPDRPTTAKRYQHLPMPCPVPSTTSSSSSSRSASSSSSSSAASSHTSTSSQARIKTDTTHRRHAHRARPSELKPLRSASSAITNAHTGTPTHTHTNNNAHTSTSALLRVHQQHPYDAALEGEKAKKDELLLAWKHAGMTYKEIRRKGMFPEAESTLRGRYRTLTRPKEARVRKPEWEENDIRLLRKAVRKLAIHKGHDDAAGPPAKIPWKQVAEYILAHGGSYHFGNATCRKRWDELVAQGQA